jgi:hypothetical protein
VFEIVKHFAVLSLVDMQGTTLAGPFVGVTSVDGQWVYLSKYSPLKVFIFLHELV